MSDLAAANCGCGEERCGCGCGNSSGFGSFGGSSCSCILWLIILMCCCGNNGFGYGGNNGDCCWIIIILLLLCGGCCGNNSCGSFRQNRGLSKGSPLFIVNAHILTLIYAYRSLFIFSSVFPESDLPSGLFPFAFFSLRQERSIS